MNILALTSTPPWPPTHGAALRNGLLLEALAAEHTVDLVTLDRPDAPPVAAPSGIRRIVQVRAAPPTIGRRLRGGWRGGVPDLLIRHGSRILRGRVQALLSGGEYHAVHVAQVQLAPLIRDVLTATPGWAERPRIVYDAHNIEWTLQAARALGAPAGRVAASGGSLGGEDRRLGAGRFALRSDRTGGPGRCGARIHPASRAGWVVLSGRRRPGRASARSFCRQLRLPTERDGGRMALRTRLAGRCASLTGRRTACRRPAV